MTQETLLPWIVFGVPVLALVFLDLGVWHKKGSPPLSVASSLRLSLLYIAMAVVFCIWLGWSQGTGKAQIWFTAFLVEKSLSLDNIFVISVLFRTLHIPPVAQHRVLFLGLLGVVVFRGIMILAGAHLVHRWAWMLDVFSVILVLTGLRLLFLKSEPPPLKKQFLFRLVCRVLPLEDKMPSPPVFWVRRGGRWKATPLFLALVMIELSDVLFAVDSIPAVFALTQDPFVVYTSNLFAILGLRALYMVLGNMVERIQALKPALAVLLVFVGAKGFLARIMGLESMPSGISLAVSVGILGAGVLWGLCQERYRKKPDLQ